ncbi:Low-density lipoprotein receptor- protein 2 [Bulinus truncatus]|nr:Low-density lipoprotein receptor- protein 2 [Bulinus truncatus]
MKMDMKTQTYKDIPLDSRYIPVCFDYDPAQDRLYFYDQHYWQVLSIKSDGSGLRIIQQLDSSELTSVQYQVRSSKARLYYTDNGLGVISSIGINGTNPRKVFTVDNPRGIAVDVQSGAGYDGSNMDIVLDTELTHPNAITIDYKESRLYFVDSGKNTIESTTFRGFDRRVIPLYSGTHAMSLDLYGDDIYFIANGLRTIMRVHKDRTFLTAVGPSSLYQFSEIKVHSFNSIEHIEEKKSADVFVRLLGGNGDDTNGRVEFYVNGRWGTVCNNTWDEKVARVVCHVLGFDREVYWTSGGASPKIQKTVYADEVAVQSTVTTGLKNPIGIAIDPNAKLVYFCDAETHTIEVMNTDGTHRKVLFTDYSSQLSGLAITAKYIYYTDLNKRTIMRLDRDGSNHASVGPPDFLQLTNIYAHDLMFLTA